MIGLQEDWQQMSPGWREKQIHDCLCGIKGALETLYAQQPLVYRGLLTQTGTDAPVAIVLENTLGETPTYSRNNTGSFSILSAGGVFTTGKTHVMLTAGSADHLDEITMGYEIVGTNNIEFSSFRNGNISDDILVLASIQILVYP